MSAREAAFDAKQLARLAPADLPTSGPACETSTDVLQGTRFAPANSKEFLNWAARSRLYSSDLLGPEAQQNLQTWAEGAAPQEQQEMLALLRNLHAAANPTRWDHLWSVASPQTERLACSCMWKPQQSGCCLHQSMLPAAATCSGCKLSEPITVPFGVHGLVSKHPAKGGQALTGSTLGQ